MEFFDRVKHGIDKTKFKADQLLRINKVQGDINLIKQQILKVFHQISNKTYELYQKGDLSNTELEALCLEVDRLNYQISQMEAEISSIRNEPGPQFLPVTLYNNYVNPCPSCGFEVPLEAVFCPQCGNPMPLKQNAPEVSSAPEQAPSLLKCTNCGSVLQNGALFCPNCGQRNKQITEQEDQPSIQEDLK